MEKNIKAIPKAEFPLFTDEFLSICEIITNKVGVECFVEEMHKSYPEYDDDVQKLIRIYLGNDVKE